MDNVATELSGTRSALLQRLRQSGLRPTRQRMALARLLFGHGHRHVSAEQLQAEALEGNVSVSLATIYNALHQFTAAGLLREVKVDGARTFFDTNTSTHHHFYIEDEERVLDVPDGQLVVGAAPAAPQGYQISGVDVVVRLRRSGR